MKSYYIKNVFYFITALVVLTGCKNNNEAVYNYIPPSYLSETIEATEDSMMLDLDSINVLNIRSLHYFKEDGTAYLSFYDKSSMSVNIYDFASLKLKKRLFIKDIFGRKIIRPLAFVKSMDSIYLTNNITFYRADRDGNLRDSIPFPRLPVFAMPYYGSRSVPVVMDGVFYTAATEELSIKNGEDRKNWKVLCKFDLNKHKPGLTYSLPAPYLENEYTYDFFNVYYCANDRRKIVFSFPADTCIYETDLLKEGTRFYAKSRFQTTDITSAVTMGPQDDDKAKKKQYLFNDSYGPLYFDPFNRKYLRISERKISKEDYLNRAWWKKKSIILFNDQFKIIGESKIDDKIDISALLFTDDGKVLARKQIADLHKLCLVNLQYIGKSQDKLTKF